MVVVVARRARRTGYGSGCTGVVLGPRRLPALRAPSRRRRSKGEAACHHGAEGGLQRTRPVVIMTPTDRGASLTPAVVEEATDMAAAAVACRLGRGGWVGYPAVHG